MIARITKCISDLKQHALTLGIGAIAGFVLGLSIQSLGAFISFGPLLFALLCLAPCLAPLLLLRRASNKPATPLPIESQPFTPSKERKDLSS